MLKPLLPITSLLLIIVAALMACTAATPTPDPTERPAAGTVAATTALIPNTPTPEDTATPAPTPLPTPAPQGLHSSLPPMDQEAVISSLSEDELACIGEEPGRMLAALTGGRPASMEEQARLVGCLDDDSVDQLFIATIIPVPLDEETSTCVQAGLDVIDPREVMTAGLEGDAATAMGGSMAAFLRIYCLPER